MARKKQVALSEEEKDYLILLLAQRIESKEIQTRFKAEYNRELEPAHIRYYKVNHEEDINMIRGQLLKRLETEFEEADVLFRIRQLSGIAKSTFDMMEKVSNHTAIDSKEYRQLADSYRKTLQQIESETAKLALIDKGKGHTDLSQYSDDELKLMRERQQERDKFLSVKKLMGNA